MCFSATASFGVSLGLSVLAVVSMRKVKDLSQYPFAAIPLVFAMQQCTEGIVWMSMTHPDWAAYEPVSSLIFLLFAQVVWPVWLPMSFLLFEKDPGRKRILKLFLLPGILVSVYFLYCLFSFGRTTVIADHHIYYNLDFPGKLIPFAAALYLISTCIPPLLSKHRMIQGAGVVILGSYLVSRIFFQPSLISVWCFFAMAISILVYMVMRLVDEKSEGNVQRVIQ
jgi:hypothetical protein